MNSLLVGCPVANRGWILPTWREHVERACEVAGVTPEYAFVVPRDDESHAMLKDWGAELYVTDEEGNHPAHQWNASRLHHMVELRNRLLWMVRDREPQRFLSCDSDILLHEQAIKRMLDIMDEREAWAVGSKTYMTERGDRNPSFGMWRGKPGGGWSRQACVSIRPAGIIMAIKMMSQSAYAIDYRYHSQGEDLGWSAAVANAGGTLWWDGGVTSRHVMKPDKLEMVDER